MPRSRSKYEPGVGKTLDSAMKNAWANAQKQDREQGKKRGETVTYVIERIELRGTNPFHEYGIFIGPGP